MTHPDHTDRTNAGCHKPADMPNRVKGFEMCEKLAV